MLDIEEKRETQRDLSRGEVVGEIRRIVVGVIAMVVGIIIILTMLLGS